MKKYVKMYVSVFKMLKSVFKMSYQTGCKWLQVLCFCLRERNKVILIHKVGNWADWGNFDSF